MDSQIDYGWTDFWAYAREHDIADRVQLDRAIRRSSNGMTPAECRDALADSLWTVEPSASWPAPFVAEDDMTWEQFWQWSQWYHFSSFAEIEHWVGRPIAGLTPHQLKQTIQAAHSEKLAVSGQIAQSARSSWSQTPTQQSPKKKQKPYRPPTTEAKATPFFPEDESTRLGMFILIAIIVGGIIWGSSNSKGGSTSTNNNYYDSNPGYSSGCGSRGGPGYRLANGKCASWNDYYTTGLPREEPDIDYDAPHCWTPRDCE